MKIPVKRLGHSFEYPVMGLGTWQMGGQGTRDPRNDDAADVAAVRTAINRGVTHIDTAEAYAGGYAGVLVGEAIKGYDRSKLFIVSKVWPTNMTYEGIVSSCRSSLGRLRTPYLDLYLLHRYNPHIPLKESVQALDEMVMRGLVKNIGVSNFSKEQLDEAQSYAKNKIVCNQVRYNLRSREPERSGLLDYCQKNNVLLVAWRPLGTGALLTDIPDVHRSLCDKYRKSPAQIALNWLISQPNVAVIVKIGNANHLRDNLGALGWKIQEEDIEKLRCEYPY